MRSPLFARAREVSFDQASTAERLVWDLDWPGGGMRAFRRQFLSLLPSPVDILIAKVYREQWETVGISAANLMLLDTRDRLSVRTMKLATDHSELRATARACASHCRSMLTLHRDPKHALAHLSKIAQSFGVSPPVERGQITVSGALARLTDESWWLRTLRTAHTRAFEAFMRDLGQVHAGKSPYVSQETLELFRQNRARNAAVLESLVAENELGEQISLKTLAEHSISNPRVKRSELMARIGGFQTVANELGHAAEFYTLTTPSRMHARLKTGKSNPRYDGTTPRKAHHYLNKLWSRIRAKLHRDGLFVYGFRIVEPHHDGTPHFHFLFWMRPEHISRVRKILRAYALEADPDEPGAAKHRFSAVAIDPAKGSAIAYVAKYVAKSIDGAGLPEAEGAKTKAERVVACTATWGQRQFQQIGSPPIGQYRELRRISVPLQGELEAFRSAADDGDFAGYLRAMGGPLARRRDLPLGIARSNTGAPGKYGETVTRTVGLRAGSVIFLTRPHRWVIKKATAREPEEEP